ncbi:hypothetical protein PAECIP112173_00605 [Paenibacillus sp. JJ-100]|nr:hypothetical protein PAECIP112173_00605 [Paenibacillus sp. JJ-100]
MGEEKPDEELMGKRKSSPRLSTTLVMSIIIEWPKGFLFIHIRQQYFSNGTGVWYDSYIKNLLKEKR